MIDRDASAGRRDQRVIIETPNESTDSFGQVLYGPQAAAGTWDTVIECWAHIEYLYGIEQRQAGREVSEQWASIQVLYRAGRNVTAKMRVRHKWNGTLFDVRAVLPVIEETRIYGNKRLVELTCLVVQ